MVKNNKITLNSKAATVYSCLAPNIEVPRPSFQTCYQTCQSYAGFLSQDDTFSKCCCKSFEGLKRCVKGGTTVFQPARVEQYISGKWTTIQTCYNTDCNPTTLSCYPYQNPYYSPTPNPNITGNVLRQYGEACTKNSECESGLCSQFGMATRVSVGNWGSPPAVSTYPICQMQESAVLVIYKQIYKAEVVAQAVTTAEFIVGPSLWPVIGSTYKIAGTAGLEAAIYYFLNQPEVTKAFDVINIGGTAFSIVDCQKNGAGGALCQMYLAGAAFYPVQVTESLSTSLKKLFINSSPQNIVYLPATNNNNVTSKGYVGYSDGYVYNRKPTIEEIGWIKKMYGVDVIIADNPEWIPYINNYAAGTSAIGSRTITLYPMYDSQGQVFYDVRVTPIHEVGHALGVSGQTVANSWFDHFGNECTNCRWTITELGRRGFSSNSPEVLSEINYMNQNAWLFKQTALNSAGLIDGSGKYVSGQQLANIYSAMFRNPQIAYNVNIPLGDFTINLQKIAAALFPR